MRLSWTAAILFALVAPCPAQRMNPPHAVASKVAIRLLNGKNGRPIKHKGVWIRIGENPQEVYRTDSNGEIVVSFGESQARGFQLWVQDFYIDCSAFGDDTAAWETKYSTDEIISKGIAAANKCGGNHANPTPGLLIVYTRKITPKEKRLI
jgi:hypothetical protein